MSDIVLRVCKSWDECVQCEELQKRVWEMPDYRDVVPANLLITAIKNGGILVGAFDRSEMVGFAFGFLGVDHDPYGHGGEPRLKHTSHMLAVLPDSRTLGLGRKLKLLQRSEALEQGLDLMTWTYDPLQAANAHLNLARLGAIARRYYRNTYGDMTDALNAGVASDRFEVEWSLTSRRVHERADGRGENRTYPDALAIYTIEFTASGMPQVTRQSTLEGETVLVEIPADYNAVKRADRELAVEWRALTRETFERAFAAGYVALDVVREANPGAPPRVAYVLQQGLPKDL